jgi:hypothetical protein
VSYHHPVHGNMPGSPDFEHGKQYRTRCGKVTGPLYANPCFSGEVYPIVGLVDGAAKTWTPAGRYTTHGEGPLDLMPGAIGAVDPQCVLQGQIEALQTRVVNLMNAVEMQQSAMKHHQNALKGHGDALKHLRHTVTNHRERIYDHVNRISKLEVSAVCDPIINGASMPSERITPPKRIIKGGWVNVYQDAAGPYFTRPWFTRDEADKQAADGRISCIQIPDITEGQGL